MAYADDPDAQARKRAKARERARRYRERRRKEREALAAKVTPLPPPPAKPKPKPKLWVATGADPGDVIGDWAEASLVVPTGPLRGQPFAVPAWEREWLTAALAPGIGEAGLSIARKNGKSGLIALACMAHMVGPFQRAHWRGVVASLTGELAKELRHAIEGTALASELDGLDVRLSPAPGHVLGPDGTRLDFLNAEKASGHALGADIAILDEAGLLPEGKRGLWNALASCVSGRDGRLWAVSIRGDGPMFGELAKRADDPAVHWREYAARPDAEIDDRQAWHDANPGLADGIKSLTYMERRSRAVLANPADQAYFRSHDLNMPAAPDRQTIVAAPDWLRCVVPDRAALPPREGDAAVGFDLGGAASMSAFAAYWPTTGRMEVYGAFPDTPGLADRGAGDGVGGFYESAEQAGELRTYPGRVTPAADFLRDCLARLDGVTVACAGADRYRKAEAQQVFSEAGAYFPVEWRGTGAGQSADGSHDVRAFQRAALGERIRVCGSLLTHAVQESALRHDVGGNPALDKGRARGRIDALSAAVIACGLGEKYGGTPGRLVVAIA